MDIGEGEVPQPMNATVRSGDAMLQILVCLTFGLVDRMSWRTEVVFCFGNWSSGRYRGGHPSLIVDAGRSSREWP